MRFTEIGETVSVLSGATGYSTAFDMTHMWYFCIDAGISATGSTGAIGIQLSNDGITYFEMTSTAVAISASTSTYWMPQFAIGAKYMRVVLVSTSGAISATLRGCIKGF